MSGDELTLTELSAAAAAEGVVVCDACPVLCRIRPGRTGACDRYGNVDGALARTDALVLARKAHDEGKPVVPFLAKEWDGELLSAEATFVTGIGSGTTYPDYKPAPFIVSSQHHGVDMVTVVSEAIFSYCGIKVKIDTDRFIGPEQSAVRCQGQQVGHVTTAEYGSQMLALGGVRHLTGGSKREGTVTCEMMLKLGDRQAVDLSVDEGAHLTIEAGRPPVINDVLEERMRVGCGSAAIGMFAKQWHGHVDEVIVVDDHITEEPLSIIERIDPERAHPGLRLLMVSTTGEDAEFFVLDEALIPVPEAMPKALQKSVERIGENCEPALSTVLFMAGAGGSLRAGVTENPVRLTEAVKRALARVTCGGAPVYVWPGGGITFMVDVTRMPERSFGYVPTPALVAPIEFTMALDDYQRLGGHIASVRPIEEVIKSDRVLVTQWHERNPWPWSLKPGTPEA